MLADTIPCVVFEFTDGTCVENGGCNDCPAQYRAKTINLNRNRQAATTSVDRAWIAFIGAVFVSFAMLFASLHAINVDHTQTLIAQESHHG